MLLLDDKFLMEIAGFPVFKEGRSLFQNGKVLEASRTVLVAGTPRAPKSEQLAEGGETFSGLVQGGGTSPFRAGLEIITKVKTRNLCTCKDSRARGIICAHSIAVAMALAKGQGGTAGKSATSPATIAQPAEPTVAPFPGTRFRRPSDPDASTLPELALKLIFPPRFEEAFAKGNVLVSLEATVDGHPTRLEVLAKGNQCVRLVEGGQDILRNLWALLGGDLADHLQLKRDAFLELLAHLSPALPVTLGRAEALAVSAEPYTPGLRFAQRADGSWRASVPEPAYEGRWLVGGKSAWLYQASPRLLRPVSPGIPASYLPVLNAPIDLTQEQGIRFLAVELDRLRPYFDLDIAGDAAGTKYTLAAAEPGIEVVLEGSLNFVEARLRFRYPDRVIEAEPPVREPMMFSLIDPADPTRLLLRNTAREESATRELMAAGFDYREREKSWALTPQPAVLQFYASTLPEWQARAGWRVEIGTRFSRVTERVEVLYPQIEVRGSGENWFEISYEMRGTGTGASVIGRDQIERMLRVGQNFTETGGKIAVFDSAVLDDFREVIQDCDPRQTSGGFRLQKNQAGFLGATLARQGLAAKLPAREDGAWTRLLQKGAEGGQDALRPIPLGPLEDVLRPYQKQGVYWLHFLAANGFGGVLADDMGLGKTLQALTFIATRERGRPTLVVCPTSLTANWRREAERFTPDLRVLVLEGPPEARAALFPKIKESDLVIISYALLRRDIDALRDEDFAAALLDEAQHIKNPDSQNAQAAAALKAPLRFVLTGTPVENRVRDLWSLFQFAMPGYLGSRAVFKERFEGPIEAGGGLARQVQDRLSRRVRPFLLRRKKEDVLLELPEKIQQVLDCPLTGRQTVLYQELLQAGRRKVDEAAGERNPGKQRMLILTALLRLRQACCDPRLLLKEGDDAPTETDSAKLTALHELLEESLDGGHRVLVFSQFSSMLRLIGEDLERQKIPYCYLDGQTRDRDAVIQKFQAADGPPVFLLSLKAGGVGLNLAAADTVVLFDPWWNPAVEMQAADRAHRMGQTRVVNVYRLVAQGTVEEKILAMQEKKRALVEALVESDEPLMQGLSMDELRSLFD